MTLCQSTWISGRARADITIVLEHLITSLPRPAAGDIPWTRTPKCSRILADVFPPDVLQSARTTAVHTLCLGTANDGVPKRGAWF
jgi:hypothetical protein